jgi:hypothetical protein
MARRDQAETEYLESLNEILLNSRIKAGARDPQRDERRPNMRWRPANLLRSNHWLQNTWRLLWAVILPLIVGYVMIDLAAYAAETSKTMEDLSESVAALAAAVIGVTGTYLGHKAGRRRRASNAMNEAQVSQEKAPRITTDEAWPFLLVIVILGVLLALAVTNWFDLGWAAVAALTASVVTVTGTHVLHEAWPEQLSLDPSRRIGGVIILASLVVGFILILSYQKEAEGWAAIAAAFVGFGGTHIGHAAGYRQDV